MGHIMKKAILLLALIITQGIFSYVPYLHAESIEIVCDKWIGQHYSKVIEAWGTPSDDRIDRHGKRSLTWRKSDNTIIQLWYYRYSGLLQTYGTTFWVDDRGIIRSYINTQVSSSESLYQMIGPIIAGLFLCFCIIYAAILPSVPY